jgi:hypothetical protein
MVDMFRGHILSGSGQPQGESKTLFTSSALHKSAYCNFNIVCPTPVKHNYFRRRGRPQSCVILKGGDPNKPRGPKSTTSHVLDDQISLSRRP